MLRAMVEAYLDIYFFASCFPGVIKRFMGKAFSFSPRPWILENIVIPTTLMGLLEFLNNWVKLRVTWDIMNRPGFCALDYLPC